MSSGVVKAILVDGADYTYSAAHNALDDVPAGARVAISAALASKTFTDGLFDAADGVVFTAVTGDPSEVLIYFIDTGVEATSLLLAFVDTGVTGFPITPNGGNITLNFNASGIFQL
jgi:hypothetical protein